LIQLESVLGMRPWCAQVPEQLKRWSVTVDVTL
jgi:hypothetical protein